MSLFPLDVLFCGGLLGLAIAVLTVRSPFSAVMMFIVFGLLVGVAWARLTVFSCGIRIGA